MAEDIVSWIDGNVPQLILLIGGLLALFIAILYVKDKDSGKYKFLVLLGLIFGVLMAICAFSRHGDWRNITCLLITVAAFTLIIRPFRDVHFALIIAVMVMVLVYVYLGGLAGYMLFGNIDLTVLSEGWVRIIIAFVAGAFVYMVLNFAEALVKLVGKLMNLWPVLAVFGLLCIAESACMFMGYGSILDVFGIEI